MVRIGLTGGIASGKSSVAKILSKHGIPIINADEISHRLLERGTPTHAAILKKFGESVLGKDGEIDRKELGRLVFGNTEALRSLEQILHPVVIREVMDQMRFLEDEGEEIVVAEVPLLFEVGMEEIFDRIWVVSATPDEQLQRLTERDKLSPSEAARRIEHQLPLSEKEEKAHAVIFNNQDLHTLEARVLQLLKTVE